MTGDTGGRALPRRHPLNLETLGNRNLLQLHTAELTEPPSPPRSWPAARPPLNKFTAVPHCERRAPIDTTDRTPLYIKQSGNKTLKSMAYSRRKRSRYTRVCNPASSIYKAQYIDATLCKMLISLFMVRT